GRARGRWARRRWRRGRRRRPGRRWPAGPRRSWWSLCRSPPLLLRVSVVVGPVCLSAMGGSGSGPGGGLVVGVDDRFADRRHHLGEGVDRLDVLDLVGTEAGDVLVLARQNEHVAKDRL